MNHPVAAQALTKARRRAVCCRPGIAELLALKGVDDVEDLAEEGLELNLDAYDSKLELLAIVVARTQNTSLDQIKRNAAELKIQGLLDDIAKLKARDAARAAAVAKERAKVEREAAAKADLAKRERVAKRKRVDAARDNVGGGPGAKVRGGLDDIVAGAKAARDDDGAAAEL